MVHFYSIQIYNLSENFHLRHSLVLLNMPVLQQPEVDISNSAELFDENDKIKSGKPVVFLQPAIDTLVDSIKKYVYVYIVR